MTTSLVPTNLSIPGNMGMDHIGIVVPNAQQAADFLIQAFGAQFDWEVKREPKPSAGERGWSEIFGVHPDAYLKHVIMLKCGAYTLAQYIELFEWCSPDQFQPAGADWLKFSDLTNAYISFTVKDIHEVMAHIKQQVMPNWPTVRFIQDPPMEFPLRGEICTSTFLVSPWGMWIELTCWSQSKAHGKLFSTADDRPAEIGLSIQDLPTPAFLIDLDKVDANIQLMRERIVGAGIHWRIPSKAHKSPALAQYIIDNGMANGVVLLTLEEAEAFAKAGIKNIYLANQYTTLAECKRLAVVAKQVEVLRISVDNADFCNNLVQAILSFETLTPIEVLLEINIGHDRCGVDSMTEILNLAQHIKRHELATGAIKFMGITGYEGHTPIMPAAEKTAATQEAHQKLAQARQLLQSNGFNVAVISAGGSCNYIDSINTGIVNEIQAGGAALGDLLYCHKAGLAKWGHQKACLMLTKITSMPTSQLRVIADAGFKQLGWHPFAGLPEIRDYPELVVQGLSAEHVRIKHRQQQAIPLAHGDKIVLYTAYTDAMGFLHDKIYAIRNDKVVDVFNIIK